MRDIPTGDVNERIFTKRKWPETSILLAGTAPDGTKYFECYLEDPLTLIRCIGSTFSKCEKLAWQQYQSVIRCDSHAMEQAHFTNGASKCSNCGFIAYTANWK